MGSEVQIGSEHFYVIGDDENNSNNIKLFSKYNLLVGYKDGRDQSLGVFTESDLGYNKQSAAAIGYVSGDNPYVGTLSFSSKGYWKNNLSYYGSSSYSDYPYVYDANSSLYPYIENYKKIIEEFGINVSEARLLTYTEARSILATDWAISTGYYTGATGGSENIMTVFQNNLGKGYYYKTNRYGLRPLIIVPKSSFN